MLHAPVIRDGLRVWFRPPLPSLRSSQPSSQSCLTTPWLPNQYQLLVQQEIPPPPCLPPSALLLLLFLPSHLFALLPAFLTAGYTSVRALVLGFWRLRMKARQQRNRDKGGQEGKVEGWRMKKVHSDAWGYCGLRGAPIVVNNRQAVKTEDEGGVCVW